MKVIETRALTKVVGIDVGVCMQVGGRERAENGGRNVGVNVLGIGVGSWDVWVAWGRLLGGMRV